MYFTKNKKNFIFNFKDIRVPSARQLVYKDRRANPTGKLPDDVWQFSRVCGTFKERIKEQPNQMPEILLERIIKASSNEEDIVLDAFCGSGTTLVAAKKLNRKYIGIDNSKIAVKISRERLKKMNERV